MASVVFEGVGGGGTLFEGWKFFLVQRIPDRQRWVSLIKENGGQVLNLDKHADIIIADHARKDVPPGSISWKFIDESVKKGKLQGLGDYRAGQPAGTIRESGSAQPPRKGRTPFTTEDDRILMEWCVKAERQGLSVKGNDLFKQLEEKNNRHTFQSWRDRWVKYLSSRPRPAAPDDDEDERDIEPSAQDGPKHRLPLHRRQVPGPAAPPRNTPAASSSSARPPPSRLASERKPERTPAPASFRPVKPAANEVFTDDETGLLVEEYEAILDISSDQEIDAWQVWATAYPSHTAQEWRNHFKEYLVPKMKGLAKKSSKKPPQETPREISPPPLRRSKATPISKPSPKPASAKVSEIQDSQDHTAPITESPQRVETELQRAISDEKFFRERLTNWEAELREEGNNVQVDFSPTICGRKVPLFRLWQVVLSEEFGGFDRVEGLRLWQRVAVALNFNEFKLAPAAAHELRDCYSDILADLEEVIRDVDGPDPTESQERAMLDAQLLETAAHETQDQDEEEVEELGEEPQELLEEEEDDGDLEAPQYSPHQPNRSSSSKRSFGNDRTNLDNSYNKRQRIDKGKGKELEIPSTPEDIINGNQPPRPSLPKPSPLKYPTTIKQEEEGEASSSEIEELVVPIPFQIPAKPKPAPEIAEPETQDFNYPQTQFEPEIKEEEGESDFFVDITSSPPQIKAPEQSSGSNAAHRGSDPIDSSTQSQTESDREKQKEAALYEYIDYRVSMGYTQEAVVFALTHTTMEVGPHCDQVMEALENGLEVPDDLSGVWTDGDDQMVEESKESEAFKDMVRKHGISRCQSRRAWLADQRRSAADGDGA